MRSRDAEADAVAPHERHANDADQPRRNMAIDHVAEARNVEGWSRNTSHAVPRRALRALGRDARGKGLMTIDVMPTTVVQEIHASRLRDQRDRHENVEHAWRRGRTACFSRQHDGAGNRWGLGAEALLPLRHDDAV